MSAEATARWTERMKREDPARLRSIRRRGQATFRKRHPEKKAAWNAVYRALKRGTLIRALSCERCGATCRTEASHDDYSKPLVVEWLCKTCHTEKDREMRKN